MTHPAAVRSSISTNFSGTSSLPLTGQDQGSDDDILVSTASSSSSVDDEGTPSNESFSSSRRAPSIKTKVSIFASPDLPRDLLDYMYAQNVHHEGSRYAACWLRSIARLNTYMRDWAQGKINSNRDVGLGSTRRSIIEIMDRSAASPRIAKSLTADMVKKNKYVYADFRSTSANSLTDTMVTELLCGPEGTELHLNLSRNYSSHSTISEAKRKKSDDIKIKALKNGFHNAIVRNGKIFVSLRFSIAGRGICDPNFFQKISDKHIDTIQAIDVGRIDMRFLQGVTKSYTPYMIVPEDALKLADKTFSSLFRLVANCLEKGNLRDLSFSFTSFSGENLQIFVENYLLNANHALDSLNLSNNFLGADRPKYRKQNFFNVLEGEHVAKGDSGVDALCLLLQSKNCPRKLLLQNCCLTDLDADQILSALTVTNSSDQEPSNLQFLYLGGNPISKVHAIWKDPRVKLVG